MSRTSRRGDPISDREFQLAKLCAQDLANKQIADKLGITEKTVDEHLYSLRRKLKCRSKIGVAVWAARQGGCF